MKKSPPEFIPIGKVLGWWGKEGELKVEVLTDLPQRFAPAATVYINHQPYAIDSCLWHKGKAIIKLDTFDSVEGAHQLDGQLIEIHHSQLNTLSEGEYYHFQLIGLEVWTSGGEMLGYVTEILTPESNDVYIVHGAKGDILIPAIEDVVKSIDLDEGRIIIEPIEGLLG